MPYTNQDNKYRPTKNFLFEQDMKRLNDIALHCEFSVFITCSILSWYEEYFGFNMGQNGRRVVHSKMRSKDHQPFTNSELWQKLKL